MKKMDFRGKNFEDFFCFNQAKLHQGFWAMKYFYLNERTLKGILYPWVRPRQSIIGLSSENQNDS
jgi:hypothetical protein